MQGGTLGLHIECGVLGREGLPHVLSLAHPQDSADTSRMQTGTCGEEICQLWYLLQAQGHSSKSSGTLPIFCMCGNLQPGQTMAWETVPSPFGKNSSPVC